VIKVANYGFEQVAIASNECFVALRRATDEDRRSIFDAQSFLKDWASEHSISNEEAESFVVEALARFEANKEQQLLVAPIYTISNEPVNGC
jgi:hypothetical protein